MAPRSRTESGLHILLTHLSNLPRQARHGRPGGDRHLNWRLPGTGNDRSIKCTGYKQIPGKHLTEVRRPTVSGLVPHACVSSLHLVTSLHCSIDPFAARYKQGLQLKSNPFCIDLQFCSLTRTSPATCGNKTPLLVHTFTCWLHYSDPASPLEDGCQLPPLLRPYHRSLQPSPVARLFVRSHADFPQTLECPPAKLAQRRSSTRLTPLAITSRN